MLRRPQILIVDRHPELLFVLTNFFAGAGFNEQELLRAPKCIRSQSFDVVIRGDARNSSRFWRLPKDVQCTQPASACIVSLADTYSLEDRYSIGIRTVISKWTPNEVVDFVRFLRPRKRKGPRSIEDCATSSPMTNEESV